jgi:hypothetical protein
MWRFIAEKISTDADKEYFDTRQIRDKEIKKQSF